MTLSDFNRLCLTLDGTETIKASVLIDGIIEINIGEINILIPATKGRFDKTNE